MGFSSWGTSFSTDSLEREYQAELGSEKVRLTRILGVLGILLALGFMLLDPWAIPDSLLTVWAIRGAIITGLALVFLCTGLQTFQRYYTHIIVIAAAVLGGGITGMIYLAGPTDVARHSYHGGLLLIIMGIYTLTYVHLYVSTAVSLSLAAVYTAVALFHHGYWQGPPLVMLCSHLFQFVSTTGIGIAAQVLRDSYSRENYLLRHMLERDVEIKEEEKRHASYLAEHDPLTGVPNRLRFEREVHDLLEHARARDLMVQILFLDLDGFKPVNDDYGHAVGDRVLKVVAERIRQSVHPDGVFARVGGDEFVVAVLAGQDERMAGTYLAERIAAALAEGVEIRGTTLQLSASIGIAAFPVDGDDLAEVLRAADAQMYVVKNRGKSGIAVSPSCRQARLVG